MRDKPLLLTVPALWPCFCAKRGGGHTAAAGERTVPDGASRWIEPSGDTYV
jgi:hypothetical protein